MRTHDVVVFGATGFTGRLVARALAERAAQTGTRWAIAGRDRGKLEALRRELTADHPELAALPILEARGDDPASLREMAAAAKVIATTVGPFDRHGDPLVDACVDGGTDYVDITGEPAFWQRTIARLHERAVAQRVLVVPCCGFDSMPHDLGALYTARALPGDGPLEIDAFVRINGEPSGGTWTSAIEAMANLRWPRSPGETRTGAREPAPRIHHEAAIGRWVVPFPSVDPLVVRRTGRFTPELGTSLRYHHYLAVRSLPALGKLLAGVTAVFAMSQLPPTRRLLLRWRSPGDGPSEGVRGRSKFTVTFIGRRGGATARTEVSGRDPGYGLTAMMLTEAALTLVHDRARLPHPGGVLTPAAALHDPLLERVSQRGLEFRRIEQGHSGWARSP